MKLMAPAMPPWEWGKIFPSFEIDYDGFWTSWRLLQPPVRVRGTPMKACMDSCVHDCNCHMPRPVSKRLCGRMVIMLIIQCQ